MKNTKLKVKLEELRSYKEKHQLFVTNEPVNFELTNRLNNVKFNRGIVLLSDQYSYEKEFYGDHLATSLNSIIYDSICKNGSTGPLLRGRLIPKRFMSDEDIFVEFTDLLEKQCPRMNYTGLAQVYDGLIRALNNHRFDLGIYLKEIKHPSHHLDVKAAIMYWIYHMVSNKFIDPNLYPFFIKYNMDGLNELFDRYTDVAIQDVHICMTKYKDVFNLICKKSKSLIMTTNHKNYLTMRNEFSGDIFKNVVLL